MGLTTPPRALLWPSGLERSFSQEVCHTGRIVLLQRHSRMSLLPYQGMQPTAIQLNQEVAAALLPMDPYYPDTLSIPT